MYLKEFEVRWSDLDANRHLANSAYTNFMSHTRMAYLSDLGLTLPAMAENNLGPVVFFEHMHYLREVLPGARIRVSLEVAGLSADGRFFEFHQNFYDPLGKHIAHCKMMGGWIDMETRKLTVLPGEFLQAFDKADKAEGFRELTREDTRRHPVPVRDLE
ncbi:acyl-CoA thioesterase [Robiginitalea sp. SC105]|uniref:acyl-CoA thioesterase n=1 Tax=Robiginitalea sp. SC105 TaxID=2762332 RepID=UPI00351C2FF0